MALGLIFPLYIYPAPTSWDPVYVSLKTNPNTPHILIINPCSGPGTALDANYTAALTQLRRYPNAMLIGYVSTAWGKRDTDVVRADIKQWALWDVDGVFLDECSTGVKESDVYRDYKAFVSELWDDGVVVINPGTPPNPVYLLPDISTICILCENSYKEWTQFRPPVRSSSCGLILHSTPTWAKEELDNVIRDVVADGYQWIFLTDDPMPNPYDAFPGYWEEIGRAVAKCGGVDEGWCG
ncbi:hypothetical protein SpCBS45565_g04668 [Spizellomyces sp. 'palustris']|nr:hypothetical protein SpCBS45565_g04668 [Spizellomyces sp. 'palustris']